MTPSREIARIAVDGDISLEGVFVAAPSALPGVLIVHGWDSDQAHYRFRAEDLAALGCVCLTFDLRGHGRREDLKRSVTREDNLEDVLAAFDELADHAAVDRGALAVIGTSYGGYLAAIACAMREVRWLALRVPAPYPDDDWTLPKSSLDREAIRSYREQFQSPGSNRALSACREFRGDVFIVGSELDDVVPSAGIASYVRAFESARSLTHRTIEGADHALSDERSQRAYDALLSTWLAEMILGARRPNSD